MFRKLVFSMVVMVTTFGFVVADEFGGAITKVDGDKITVQKYKPFEKGQKTREKDGEPITLTVAKDAKILKGKFDFKEKKVSAGDALEGGLKADEFKKATEEKGVNVRITTDDTSKKVTQILVIQFGGFKKKDAKKDTPKTDAPKTDAKKDDKK